MKRITFSIFSIALMLILGQIQGLACTCDLPWPKRTLKEQVKRARKQSLAIFSGRVLEITQSPEKYFIIVKLAVDSSWKGSISQQVNIATGRGSGDCGYRFEIGERYLVYAYGDDENSLGTNICQRTNRFSDSAPDIKMLGSPKLFKTDRQ